MKKCPKGTEKDQKDSQNETKLLRNDQKKHNDQKCPQIGHKEITKDHKGLKNYQKEMHNDQK